MDGECRALQRAFDASGADQFIVGGSLIRDLHEFLGKDIKRQEAGIKYFEENPSRLGPPGRTANRRLQDRFIRLDYARLLLAELEETCPALCPPPMPTLYQAGTPIDF